MDYIADLRATVDGAAEHLSAIGEEVAARRAAPGRWSIKEIIGHLIDSAANNHRRFVRAARQDDLVFEGYAQDEWVASQRYQEAPWTELLDLWRAYNRQLARVMAAVPAEARFRPRDRHNLEEIAWRALPDGTPATLDWLMEDYVGHLHHHLGQIEGLLGRGSATPPV